jgi:hypothetical protein
MAKIERRVTRLRRARQAAASPRNRHTAPAFSNNNDSTYCGLNLHHHISKLRKNTIHLLQFAQLNAHDPAVKVCFNEMGGPPNIHLL